MPPRRTWLWFLLVLLANYLLMRFLMPSPDAPVTVPYTLFKEEVGKGNVQAIYSRGETITGRFKAPVTYPRRAKRLPCPAASPKRRVKRVQRLAASPKKRLSAARPPEVRPKR